MIYEFKRKMWKVPFRQVYTNTFKHWVQQTVWCHLVIKMFPRCHDFGSDNLCDYYKRNPEKMYEQLECIVDKDYVLISPEHKEEMEK